MTKAQQFDEILEIRDNGDIVLTDEAYQNFKDTLAVDCKIARVEEAYDQWIELKAKSYEFAARHRGQSPQLNLNGRLCRSRLSMETGV
jgi:hypothetical protein